jgi:predicted ATPase
MKVVLSGCSGGGKSTLLAEMARRGYRVCPEPGRQIVREQLTIGGDGVPWDNPLKFIELCLARAIALYDSYDSAADDGGFVLFDRSVVDAASACASLGRPLPAHIEAAVRRCRYAATVFFTPPWEALFAEDSERRHGFADAVTEYERLLASYPAHGYTVVVVPRGGVAERADFLERQLRKL